MGILPLHTLSFRLFFFSFLCFRFHSIYMYIFRFPFRFHVNFFFRCFFLAMNLDLDLAPKFNVLIIVCDDFSSLSNNIVRQQSLCAVHIACFACQFSPSNRSEKFPPNQEKTKSNGRCINFNVCAHDNDVHVQFGNSPSVLSIPISINEKINTIYRYIGIQYDGMMIRLH